MSLFRLSIISAITAISAWKVTDYFLENALNDLPFLAKVNLKRSLLRKEELSDEMLDDTISLLIDNGWSAASPEVTKIKFYAARRCMHACDKECMKRWLLVLKHVPHVGEGFAQELARMAMIKELKGKLFADMGSSEKRGNE